MKNKLLPVILVLSLIFISGCATKGPKRDDFGCWPPSCKMIPDESGRQICEDWKAGKTVTWFDCSFMAEYPKCQKLCEYESANKTKSIPAYPTTAAPNASAYPSQGKYPDMPGSFSPSDFLFHTRKPACVDETDYHTQIIYARPSDSPDRYDTIAPKLRTWIAQSNGLVNNEAEKFGMTADIKVICADGEVSVLNVKLPKSSSEYNTHDGKSTPAIASSLKELGYGSAKVKYIVYYDGNTDGCEGGKHKCSGQASQKDADDSLSEDNAYNSGPDYSLLYDVGLSELPQRYHTTLDMLAPIVMLHEYSHTLGAVQSSAPNSAKDSTDESGHCNDEYPQEQGGNDVMCKSDKQGTMFKDSCKDTGFVFHYDCNNDDYFNPKPEAGSYLATHWNLGSDKNRFFKFGTA